MNTAKKSRPWLIPVLVVGVIALVVAGVIVGSVIGRNAGRAEGKAEAEAAARPAVGADGRIGYASNGVVATDPETFQDIVDKMYEEASKPGIALEYKDLMVSDDGVNFTCYIGNSEDNNRDIFITIYGDQKLTEEWFLSELIRPGTRFEQVAFQKKLPPGKYTGYLVYTKVGNEAQKDGTFLQVIEGQIATTINIVVNDY